MLRGILWILWVAGVVAPVVAAGDHAEKKGTESPDDACVARVNRRFAASPVESITHALLGWGQHLEFLPGSKDMVALHADGNLSVYKPDGSVVKKIEIGSLPDSFHGLALSGDGKLAAVSHSEGIRRQSVRILDLQSGREKTSFVLPGDLHTMGLNFSRDGKYLACGSSPAVGVQPALYFVYDTAAGKPIPLDLNGAVPSNLSTSIEFSPDGRFVYAAGGGGELLRWTRPFDGKPQVVATVGGQTPPPLRRFRLTPDGKRVIAVDGGRTIRMVDLSDGKEKMVVSADEGSYFMGISVSPDGGAVAAVSVDRVTDYDLARGKKIAT